MRPKSISLGFIDRLMLPICSFGGGGGGQSAPPPPPAPPAPPAPKAATTTSRSLLAQLMPKRTRASTVLTGGPSVSGPTVGNTQSILGTPLVRTS